MFMRNTKLEVEFSGYIYQITRVQGYTKIPQYIAAYGGKFFKTSFDMVIEHNI